MKRLLCLLLLLCFLAPFAHAQTRARKKKRRRKPKITVPAPAVFPVIEVETSQTDIIRATKLATGFKTMTPEIKQNNNFYHSDQTAIELKKATAIALDEFISNTELKYHDPSQNVIYVGGGELLPQGRIVNGPSQYDSRVEIRALDPTRDWVKKIIRNGYSVAVIVDRSRLRSISKGFYQIDDGSTLGTTYQLCPGEAFRNQPVVGTGTAIVTGKRQMLTASHVFAGPLSQYVVIFGFEITNKAGAYQTVFPADSVYFPTSMASRSADLDIAAFNVDRDLNAQPLKWSAETDPPINEPIYMIGFPYGLPKKVAANAEIITPNNDLTCFYTSLDAFQGNSGSPVFNLKTNEVIGILVSGNVDYHWNGSCNVSVDCSAPYCQGEKAIRITSVKNLLNNGK